MAEYKDRFPTAPLRNARLEESLGKGSRARAGYHAHEGKDPDHHLMEFLVGALLGDGSLSASNGRQARYTDGGSNLAYIQWKAEFLEAYFPVRCWDRLSRPDSRTGKRYAGRWLKTGVHPLLTQLRRFWYADRKVIPHYIVSEHLTKFAFAVWFCDDGYLGPHGAILYTMGFSAEEVEFLAELLRVRFGFASSLLRNKAGQPFLRFPARVRPAIIRTVGTFRLPGMEYKYE